MRFPGEQIAETHQRRQSILQKWTGRVGAVAGESMESGLPALGQLVTELLNCLFHSGHLNIMG